jgi:hypothetical protein
MIGNVADYIEFGLLNQDKVSAKFQVKVSENNR